ncbi:hypothetical protein AAHC03_027148 [Spirometra sp. Aus1]
MTFVIHCFLPVVLFFLKTVSYISNNVSVQFRSGLFKYIHRSLLAGFGGCTLKRLVFGYARLHPIGWPACVLREAKMLTFESDPRVLLSSRKIIQSLPTFLAESLVTSNYAFSKFLSNDWVIITTSNQLFVWNFKPKSSSKQPQLSTSCRSFDLPGLTDDEPWVTSRLTCLSFGTATNEPGSNLTPTLLACVSTDGLFRVWQRIHRRNDFIDSDLEIQSHPDEVAHSLEPGPLPGTFLLATTFGRVFGIDARFPQAGISARLIPPPGDTEDEPFSTSQPLRRETANSSLLSGLSRRVSSILSYASSRVTTTLSGGVNEKRQCELVRFTTRQLSSEEDNRPGHFSCLAAIMFRHRLDVWRVLEDFSPVALLKLDFASDLPLFNSLRQPSAAVVPLDLTFSSAYVLQPRPAPALHLLLRSIDAESQMPCLFLVTLVNDEPKNVDQWVYAESATVVLEGEESVEQEDTDLRLVFPDPAARSTYPCLLAAVHWLRKNSACVFEAATGRSVVHVTVNSRTNATTANELIAVQSCNQKSTLFAFITRQSGVHCLLADPSVAASCCGELKGPDTSLRTLDVECSITENPSADPTYDFFSRAAIVFWLGYEQEAERRVRRFFGSNSIHRLSSRAPAGGTTVAEAFLHLARRVIDSRPSGDPRWRSTGFTSSAPAHLDDTASSLGSNATLGPLESTDETAFDFARPQAFPTGLVTEDQEAEHHALSPLAARFAAKHLGLKRLALFWRLADEYASPSSLPLSSLALLLVPGEEAEMSAEGQEEEATKLGGRSLYSRRRFTVWKDEEDDDPLYMVQESSGSHLNWDPPHLTEAELEILNSATVAQLEQALGEGADSCGPTTHVLNAFLVADELVEFVRTLHSRLRRVKNQQLLHQVFSKVVQGSGFLEPDLLCNLSPQDIFWQSISLAPRLIITLSAQLRADLEETQESLESLPPGQDPAGLLAPLRTAAQLLTTSLSAAVTHRAKFLPTLRSSLRSSSRGYADHDHELPCWITDAFPFGVGDSLLNLFDLLVRWGSPKIGMDSPEREEKSVDAVLPSGDTECACQAVELASILLRAAHQRVTWMRRQQAQVAGDGNSSAAFRALVRRRRLEVWFARLRSRLISDIAYRLKRPESALSLAEKFLDREQIVSLCDLLDRNLQEDGPAGTCFLDTTGCTTSLRRHDNLARLLTLLPTDLQLANYALQWHYERGEKARVQSLLALLQKLEAAGPTTERREIEEEEEEEATEPSLKRPRHPSRDEDSALFQTRKSTPASRLATSRRPCRSPMAPTGDLAAQDLYSAGLAEGELLGRRRTLLSLSKLAQIAGDAENVQKRRMLAATDASDRPRNRRYFGDDLNSFPSPRTAVESLVKPSENGVNTHLETIDLQLEAIGYQADLTKSLVPPTGEGDMSCGRVMSLSHVARLYVSGARPLSPEAPAEFTGRPGLLEFCRALRLSELLLLIPTAESQAVLESEHTDLLLYIWSQAIKMDSWKQAESDEDALTMSEGTFFYSLLTHCLLSGSRLSQIFPPIDELLAYGKLSPLSENVWFPFAIKSCYNHAVAKASKSNSLGLVTMPVIS